MQKSIVCFLLLGFLSVHCYAGSIIFTPPDQVATNSSYQVTIRRIYSNAQEAKCLQTAERVHPEKDKVTEIMSRRGKQALEANPTEHPWWCDTFDGVFIPYAITADALSYYVQLSDSFRKGDFSGSKNITMKSSSLNYQAQVTHHNDFEIDNQSFQDVIVVTMYLSWEQYCGPLCAMGFSKTRVVVFSRDEVLQGVFHDGETGVIVS